MTLVEPPAYLVMEAEQFRRLSDAVLAWSVAVERKRGATWVEIGSALGVTKATAHGRFAEVMALARDRTPGQVQAVLDDLWRQLDALMVMRAARLRLIEQSKAV